MTDTKPDIYARGTRVEICAFRRGHSHHYLAKIDGMTGTVEGLGGGAEEDPNVPRLLVLLDGEASSEAFPVRALKPISKE